MQTATRLPRATWILGLGGALGGALLWACSSHSAPPILAGGEGNDAAQPLVDASVADTGTSSDGAAPTCTLVEGGCVSLQNCGTKVNVTEVAQTPPIPGGGTVVAGTYVMTDLTVFTGAGGATGDTGHWYIETRILSAAGDDGGAPMDAGAQDGGQAGDAGAGDDDASTSAEAGAAPQVFQFSDVSESDTTPARTLTGTTTYSTPQRVSDVYDCPSDAGMFTTVYTATPTTIQLFATESAGVGVITYTKM
jgi:hypothetical protein